MIAGGPVFVFLFVLLFLGTFFHDRFPHFESFKSKDSFFSLFLFTGISGAVGGLCGGSIRGYFAIRSVSKRHRAKFGTRAIILGRRGWKALGTCALVAVIAAGLWFAYRECRYLRLVAQIRSNYTQAMTGRIRDFFFVHGRTPESYEEFRGSGLAPLTPFEVDVNRALRRRGDQPDAVSRQVFAGALASSRSMTSEWDEEARRWRKRLSDLEGHLKAQLDLFLDPDFEPLVATRFLKTLKTKKGVDAETLSEFIEANREMRSIQAFLTGPNALPPELALVGNAEELAPIFRAQQEKRHQEVRRLIEERRDEILTDIEEAEE